VEVSGEQSLVVVCPCPDPGPVRSRRYQHNYAGDRGGRFAMIQANIAAITHVGLVRTSHQDAIHLNGWTASSSGAETRMTLSGSGVAAVIDGMGGHRGGEVASRTASAAIADLRLVAASSPRDVDAIVQQISDIIRETGEITEGHASMGATIAGVVLQSNSVILFNVGDCSILRIKDGYIGQLAIIDRVANENERRGMVTQALGGTPQPTTIDAHAEMFVPAHGDLLVLCSDGLTDVVDNTVIASLAAANPQPVALADQLIETACRAGAPDNVSVVVLAFSVGEQAVPAHEDRPHGVLAGSNGDPRTSNPAEIPTVSPQQVATSGEGLTM
jgi:serine/threonine protein phosphatase PrpC